MDAPFVIGEKRPKTKWKEEQLGHVKTQVLLNITLILPFCFYLFYLLVVVVVVVFSKFMGLIHQLQR